MGAMTRVAEWEWEDSLSSPNERSRSPLKIGPFLVGGREPVWELPLIDLNRRGVYITFPEDATPAENDFFRIVRPLRRREDTPHLPGQARRIVAEVKIMSVDGSHRARVQVLRGSIIKGTAAERIPQSNRPLPKGANQ